MQLQPHVIELQRIFYTVNPVQVSGGGEQNVWGASGKFGGGSNCPPCPDLEPPLRLHTRGTHHHLSRTRRSYPATDRTRLLSQRGRSMLRISVVSFIASIVQYLERSFSYYPPFARRAKGEVFVLLYVFCLFFLFGQRFLSNPRADSRQSSRADVAWVGTSFLPFWGLAAPGGRKKWRVV